MKSAAFVLVAFLAGCANIIPAIQKAAPALTAACHDAMMVATIASFVPGVGAVAPYITAGCATAEGLAKLASDPDSVAWVGQLTGMVKALSSKAGVKLP